MEDQILKNYQIRSGRMIVWLIDPLELNFRKFNQSFEKNDTDYELPVSSVSHPAEKIMVII